MVDVDVHLLSNLKEQLAWAVDKWLSVISIRYNVHLETVRVLRS